MGAEESWVSLILVGRWVVKIHMLLPEQHGTHSDYIRLWRLWVH